MALARGSCVQGAHAPRALAPAWQALWDSAPPASGCGLYRTSLSAFLDARPCLVSWSQHSGGAESTDSLQLPSGQMPAMLSGQQILRG